MASRIGMRNSFTAAADAGTSSAGYGTIAGGDTDPKSVIWISGDRDSRTAAVVASANATATIPRILPSMSRSCAGGMIEARGSLAFHLVQALESDMKQS